MRYFCGECQRAWRYFWNRPHVWVSACARSPTLKRPCYCFMQDRICLRSHWIKVWHKAVLWRRPHTNQDSFAASKKNSWTHRNLPDGMPQVPRINTVRPKLAKTWGDGLLKSRYRSMHTTALFECKAVARKGV